MRNEEKPIVETAVQARGGLLGRPVLIVLVISLLLIVAVFTGIYLGYFSKF